MPARSRMHVVVSRDPTRRPVERTRVKLPVRWIVVASVAAIIAVGAWHYITLYTSMANARDDLLSTRDRLEGVGFEADQRDIDAARQGLARADANLSTARKHYRFDPLIRIAALVPGPGRQVEAAGTMLDLASTLVDLGQETAAAAQKAIDLRENRDQEELLTHSLVRALEDARPELERMAVLSRKAIEQRRELGDGSLWRPLNNARRHLDADLPGIAANIDQLQRAADLLPGFLGFEGERRYLVLALNSGELLPGGGLVTAAGVVTVSEGVNGEIGFVDSTGWLPAAQALGIPYIEPPAPLKRYLLRDFSWNLLVSNWDPDFPTWSQHALELYELVNGPQQVDGIVAVDLVVLEQLLTVTGPKVLEVPDRGVLEFTPINAVLELERLTRPAYIVDAEDRKSIIGALAEVVLSDLLRLPSDRWAVAIRTVRRMGAERHIQVLSFDEREQALVRDAGWDGRLHEPESDFLHLSEASVLSTKLNLIIHPEGTLRIEVTPLGDVVHELNLTYRNDLEEWAKDKDDDLVQKLMLGGLYGGYLRLFGNSGMTVLGVELDGGPGNIEDFGQAPGTEWFGTMVPVSPGETREVTFRWRTTPPGTSASRYSLFIQKQAGTIGMCLDIQITRSGKPAREVAVKGGVRDARGRWCLSTDMHISARF